MDEDGTTTEYVRRIRLTFGLGGRICLLLGVLLLVLAGWLYWSPVGRIGNNGFPIVCGTAQSPTSLPLAKALCGTATDGRRDAALAVLIVALVVAAGGVLAFGAHLETVEKASEGDEVPEPGDTTPEEGDGLGRGDTTPADSDGSVRGDTAVAGSESSRSGDIGG